MKIQLIDHIVYADFDDLKVDDAAVNRILDNTVETWQPDRSSNERGKNTLQGKIAEDIVEEYLHTYFANRLSLKSYDEIRNDDYTKHAPFDFLIWESGKADLIEIENSIRNDISLSRKQYVSLSSYTRQLCKDKNVKIAEVKSTDIRKQLKKKADFNGNYDDIEAVTRLAKTIKDADDVLCYPHYKRKESRSDYSLVDYCNFVKTKEISLKDYEGKELEKKVIEIEVEKQLCDIFIRVYIDSEAKKGFVIGWMQREHLLDYSVILKRMYKTNKSENALYFAKSLREADSLENLTDAFTSPKMVYASPYTKTDFYHKTPKCDFLKGLSKDEIIVYQSEEVAIKKGKHIHRCKKCF